VSEEFQAFPKIPRLSRNCVVTEKLDGTNASVFLEIWPGANPLFHGRPLIARVGDYVISAGSRTRWITPDDDNFGFASWVQRNADELVKLGEGHHFGEWWGHGIQRNYGLTEKRFSLFNTTRWTDEALRPACCHVVPKLYEDRFDTLNIDAVLYELRDYGSSAVPGFMNPEGVMVYHEAAKQYFKKTIQKDEERKSAHA